jgi:riboflavin kinase/FMN adenylyltransferase
MTDGFVLATDPSSTPPGLAGAAYAIGNFDGVHLGHQAVIGRTAALAASRGVASAVLTFEPHPADFFAGRPIVFRLTDAAQKAGMFRSIGLDGAAFLTFDAELASLDAATFVEKILVGRLACSAVVVGWDFHFGKGRSGNPQFLVEAGARHGFAVEVVEKVVADPTIGGHVVSSSSIRRALERGDVAEAALGLGRHYVVGGRVIAGRKLGRALGAPTANIALLPTNRLAHGIYAVRAILDGHALPAVASFGVRPTVDHGAPLLETHLLDFSGDLYGSTIEVAFVERIREERRFESLALLSAEMERDKLRAREILGV